MARRRKLVISIALSFALMVLGAQALAQGGTWTTKAPMPTARSEAAAGVVNGILYVVGGGSSSCPAIICATVEAYDPATNTWTTKAPMPTLRAFAAAGVVNSILYVAGGGSPSPTCPSNTCATVEAYDPSTNIWTTKAPMLSARSGVAAGVVNGILYVVGGRYSSTCPDECATVEAYSPATNTWTSKTPMPTPRYGAAAGVVNGVLYVAGGFSSACPDKCATVEAYSPATNTWTSKTPMPTPRYGAAAGVVNGILYVVGGRCPSDTCATVEAYDPSTNTWTSKTLMPTPRYGAAAGVVNGVLYVVGGVGNSLFRITEAFTPEISVVIDIKPEGSPNSINTRSHGLIPVAILSGTAFEAPAVVNKPSVRFGRTGNEPSLAFCNASGEDVNFDGLPDLVCHFFTQETGFQAGDTIGILTGQTVTGMGFRGTDSVRIVR